VADVRIFSITARVNHDHALNSRCNRPTVRRKVSGMHSKRTWWPVTLALGSILVSVLSVGAQNFPPPGAYQPIPNFTGVGAGLQFRQAINDRFSGAQPILPLVVGPSFANLPAEQDGVMLYCKDCKRATPCVSGGSGAWALGTRGQWSCASGALEASLNANGNKITSLANGTVTGDALAFGQTSGGDLGGSLPNPTVATVLGGQTPVTRSTAMTGDLSGTLPAPTVQTVLGGKAPIYSGQTGAQINTMAGSKSDGSNVLTGFNVNGIFNVKAFGAKGDGGTDDSGAIQAAINAACAVNSGGDGAGNFTNVAGRVMLPSAPYYLLNPLWMNCSGLQLVGTGRYSSVLEPAYDFGKTIAVVGTGYQGLPTAASLVTGAGNAADFTLSQSNYYLNLREWGGRFGPLGNPDGLNLNGLSAFTVEAFVEDQTAGDGTIVGSGSLPDSVRSYVGAFELRINSGDWSAALQTTGGSYTVYGAAVPQNTIKYVAETYDGTTLRLYDCTPGATNCAVDGSVAATGTIVQDPTEDVDVGRLAGGGWPDGSLVRGAIKGYIDSVRISKIARWTGTIANVPNTKFNADSNTLIVTNFEKNPNGSPFIRAYDFVGGGWLFEYNSSRIGITALNRNSIRDISISPVGLDNSGIIVDAAHDDDMGPIQMSAMDIGLEVWNIAYENNFHDITIASKPGRYGIVNNSNDNNFTYTKVSGGWAGYDFGGSGTLINPIFVQNGGVGTGSAYGLVMPPGGQVSVEMHSPWWDVENGGTGSFKAGIYGSAISNVDVFGGQIGTASGAPAIWLDNGGNASVVGTEIGSIEGSPPQIVKLSGGGTQSVTLVNPLLSGWGSASLSTTPGVVTMIPCKGTVALAAGAGTFSSACVTTTSLCIARDATTAANAVTLGVPANRSVAVSGTGTDSIVVSCN
jgi:Pectate lyase superfamily protein/Concanavalin A-like lectin/glucanases superfamily